MPDTSSREQQLIAENAALEQRVLGLQNSEGERQRVKEALRESEDLLAQAEELGMIGGWTFDIDTGQQTWTRGVYAIHELEFTGRVTVDQGVNYYSPASRPIIQRAVQRATEQGESFDVELEIITAKGNLRSVHAIGKADLGRRKVSGFIQDVTERKKAEDALRESENKFRGLFEWMGGGIQICEVVLDEEGRAIDLSILDVNPAYEKHTGISPEQVIGKRIREVLPVVEQAWLDRYRDLVRTREPIQFQEYSAAVDRWFDVHASALSGNTIAAFFTDITERRRAEAEKIGLAAQLQQAQKMEAVGRLAGGVAHDFNNMLGVIIGHTELVLGSVDETSPLHASLTEIRSAANRSADLTRQLLAFARRQIVEPRILNLNDTIGGMLKLLRRLIGEDVELTWQPGESVWPVSMDPSHVDQILANLCVNARDAIVGVGAVTVATSSVVLDERYCAVRPGSSPGEYVRLTVSDTGSGMDEATRACVFEPFFTTKELGKGTGLGLSSVYGAVKQAGGYIEVESAVGAGTTITLYLPRHLGEHQPAEADRLASPDLRGDDTVLLVEDEPSILYVTERLLERRGYRVLAARTPSEAIHLAETHAGEIQLLLTDVVMPQMDGLALAQSVGRFCPDAKVLYMSGYTGDVIAGHGVLDRGMHFIQKPFTASALAAKVREALASK